MSEEATRGGESSGRPWLMTAQGGSRFPTAKAALVYLAAPMRDLRLPP